LIDFCGIPLEHEIINGSGTFDAIAARRAFGDDLLEQFPFSAFVSKTITLKPRAGNPPPRLWETAGGMINSIGLPNKGLAGYLEQDLPQLAELPVPLITNVMGSTAEELAELAAACDARPEIAAIELNVSCPNVATGLDIGAVPGELERVVARVRPATSKPLIVKLTPNCADVAACAVAAQEGGADAVSLINTLRAMALRPSRQAHAGATPWLGGGTGGLSGPAIRPVALAQVAAVAQRVSIPVIGMGGIQTSNHARQFLDVGATLVAVGTESFRDPMTGARIAREL
jgi:dihydroorotate dehydrogenase (NAD+) catalytic subunit